MSLLICLTFFSKDVVPSLLCPIATLIKDKDYLLTYQYITTLKVEKVAKFNFEFNLITEITNILAFLFSLLY